MKDFIISQLTSKSATLTWLVGFGMISIDFIFLLVIMSHTGCLKFDKLDFSLPLFLRDHP
jgi:uncharacterized membrane protein (DUF485 family)